MEEKILNPLIPVGWSLYAKKPYEELKSTILLAENWLSSIPELSNLNGEKSETEIPGGWKPEDTSKKQTFHKKPYNGYVGPYSLFFEEQK